MYELISVGPRTWYMDCPTRVGVYEHSPGRVCCIDSGSDGGAAKRLLRHLEERGWTLTAIFNTHSHADHVGGNSLLQARTGVPAYAWGVEAPFVRDPVLEPMVLFGAHPYREIRNKFLEAKPSDCRALTEDVLPPGLTFADLHGHAAGMVGYRTDDDVWFVADAVLSEEALEKYHVSYLYDVGAYAGPAGDDGGAAVHPVPRRADGRPAPADRRQPPPDPGRAGPAAGAAGRAHDGRAGDPRGVLPV